MSTCECYTNRGFIVKSADFGKEYCKGKVCALVNMKKTRNHALTDRCEYEQGQFYYVDYSGQFEVSRQGNYYMVLFVDRHTRLIIGFFVKKKDEATAIEIIKQFIKENLAAPMFKGQGFLQSDNGEFHSKKVKLYSWASGIFQRFSSRLHSLMNGPVERDIQKVKVVGKCMLEDRRMPQLF